MIFYVLKERTRLRNEKWPQGKKEDGRKGGRAGRGEDKRETAREREDG